MSAENDIESGSRGFTNPSARSSQVSPKHLVSWSSEKISDSHTEVASQLGGDLKPSVNGSRFWAIIIGVNTYPYDDYLQTLSGAVSDALSMHEYLTNELKVPFSNIRLLTEGNNPLSWGPPTRDNIINALYDHLRDNELVEMDDNMLIYFAGHGSSYSASSVPGSPSAAGSIEAICPMDRGRKLDRKPSPKPGDDVIPDISDREINIFLSELCREKGANITVVYDCCHSGGMARGLDAEGLVTRFGAPLPDTPDCPQLQILLTKADDNPRRRSWSQKAFSDTYEPDTSSSVHLAACKHFERAHEFRHQKSGTIHGLFTYRLLTELRNSNSQTKYSDIEKKLKFLSLQQPEFVGSRMGCRLWYTDDLRSVRPANGVAPERRAPLPAEQGDKAGTGAPFKRASSHARTSSSSSGRQDTSKLPIHLKESGALEANAISPVQHIYNAPSTLNNGQPPPTFAHPNSTGPEGPVRAPSGRMRTPSHPSMLDSRPQSIGLDAPAVHDISTTPGTLHLPEQNGELQSNLTKNSYEVGHSAALTVDHEGGGISADSEIAARINITSSSHAEAPLAAGENSDMSPVEPTNYGENLGCPTSSDRRAGEDSQSTQTRVPVPIEQEPGPLPEEKKQGCCSCCTIM